MRNSRGLWIAAGGIIWLLGLGAYPLTESTEGRYASVAWVMAHGGSWLEPVFNGAPLFTKPPVAYWTAALFLRFLPDTAWAVRLPGTLLLLAAAWLTRGLALASGLGHRRAVWAGFLAFLAPPAVFLGRATTGDMFLWVGILMALLGILQDSRSSSLRAVLIGLGLALGFMAKGHIVLLWVILPLVVWSVTPSGEARRLRRLAHPLTLLFFLGLSLPWFLAAIHRHPELVRFWLHHETVARVATNVHGRSEPWWYFLPLVPVVALPWLPETWRGLRSQNLRNRNLWLWLIGIPLLVFTLSVSKRPNYLLPMVTPLALLAAAGISDPVGRGFRLRVKGWALVALAVPFLMGALGWGPPTRALAEEAARRGRDLVAWKSAPSSLTFYHRGPVPVYPPREPVWEKGARPHGGELDALRRSLDAGALVLVQSRRVPDLQAQLGLKGAVVFERGTMQLLGFPAPSPR